MRRKRSANLSHWNYSALVFILFWREKGSRASRRGRIYPPFWKHHVLYQLTQIHRHLSNPTLLPLAELFNVTLMVSCCCVSRDFHVLLWSGPQSSHNLNMPWNVIWKKLHCQFFVSSCAIAWGNWPRYFHSLTWCFRGVNYCNWIRKELSREKPPAISPILKKTFHLVRTIWFVYYCRCSLESIPSIHPSCIYMTINGL